MNRKLLSAILIISLFAGAGCKKDESECNEVTVVKFLNCGDTWGIIYKQIAYPCANIPEKYKENGKWFCATYTVYDAPACSGNVTAWAEIKFMKPRQ